MPCHGVYAESFHASYKISVLRFGDDGTFGICYRRSIRVSMTALSDNQRPPSDYLLSSPSSSAAGQAVFSEAAWSSDIVHTSLAGMTGIMFLLLLALALPIMGFAPIKSTLILIVMIVASAAGIGGMYYINYRVHQHVLNQARLTEVLVNSLGQGFLYFDRNGLCGKVYSSACAELLEGVPAGRHIIDVLRIPSTARDDFIAWVEILFQPDHALAFQDVVKFLPSSFQHSGRMRISLVYRPIYATNNRLESVVVIATDCTGEQEAKENERRQEVFAEMVCRVFRDRNQFNAIMANLQEFLDAANAPGLWLRDAPVLLRQLHTLKAAVRHFSLIDLGNVIHAAELALRAPSITDDETFRNELQKNRRKIADAMNVVMQEIGELMGSGTGDNRYGAMREIAEADLYDFAREMQRKGISSEIIHSYLSKIAAVPIRECFQIFERSLMELSGTLDKQVKPLLFIGENPRVLTKHWQGLIMSLSHISRNIIDHGIEPPITRLARGKDEAGQVTVLIEVKEDKVTKDDSKKWKLRIVISDDGNGVDATRVRAKLATLDPDGNWQQEDDNAVIQRIFSWGVSTTDKVTEISGHGVGLEAVEREVQLLGGNIRVVSELYKGTSFEIVLPYQLKI